MFYYIEGLEVVNIFIYGTRDFAQYPIGIYNKAVRIFFTYLVPIGLTSYFPMLYITGASNNLWYIFLPLLSIITLIPACLIFNADLNGALNILRKEVPELQYGIEVCSTPVVF